MDIFIRTVAGVFFALILIITVSKREKDLSAVLTIGVCAMIGVIAFSFFQPVVNFLVMLQEKTGVDSTFFWILIKAVGIASLGEMACHICTDAGHGAIGKVVELLSSAVILWLSLPLLEKLLSLVDEVLQYS